MNSRRFLVALIAALTFAVTVAAQTNVRDFLADGVKDAGPAIQQALDSMVRPAGEVSGHYYPTSGGVLDIPDGVYRVYAPITIPPTGNLEIRGSGGPFGQSRVCIIEYYGKGPLFEFAQPTKRVERHNGFKLSNILIWGKKLDDNKIPTQTAMKYVCDPAFSQGFTFERVGFYYWSKVLHVTTEKAEAEADEDTEETFQNPSQMGSVRFIQCEAHDNKQFIDARVGKMNMTRIRDSYISKNRPDEGDYVIDLATPQNLLIQGSSLEGQPRVLRGINGSGITIDQCQWEGQTGTDPVVYFKNCRGIDWRSQHYHRFESDAPVWLELDDCEGYYIFPNTGRVITSKPWKWRGN